MEIKVKPEELKLVPTEELKPNPKNRNKHSKEQIDRLVQLIHYQGFRQPIIVSKRSGFVVAGHGRLEAARLMRIASVPVFYQDFDSEEQEYAFGVSDNAIASWAELDLSGINVDIPDFGPDFNLDLLGIKDFVLDPADKVGMCDEDEVPEPKESIAKLGDVWQLGEHRLMCGDSTDIGAVERLMNGEVAELCFTSPPYADQREYNGDKDLSTEHLATFIRTAHHKVNYFVVNLGYSRKNGEVNPYWDDYIREARNCGLKFLSWNIWDKGEAGSIGNQTAMFAIEHEWILVFGEFAFDLNLTVKNKDGGAKQHGTIRNKDGSTTPIKGAMHRKVRDFSQMKTIVRQTPQKARNHGINHPAMFPVEFPEKHILAMTDNGNNVYEPFGGSGSTLIACEKTNRRCFMMELDPHYVDVIIARWEKYSGKKAELLGQPS